ncbi:TIGR01459 family HAD-type hydrolase [Martelella radicis]|uniref:HAD superfamily hydrolase (TIGR01459 family) n=1 Tax=Martelella radicis TaxID=1397476 RepID=A0A7W6KQ58_9HYPH|nr:TIGR01459 family HAD-type hydrolase [Martelella radicis]MBB4124040.1 HAD superfamily hydrolase (TIGR01459 family) [Martelella radicis]
MPRSIPALSALYADYDVVLCDVWGVLHNGVAAFAEARSALSAAREAGKTVILLTNSPRLSPAVAKQLAALEIYDESYDGIVTSGDVTKTLVAEGPRKLFHLGPKRDTGLIDGTGASLVGEAEAEGILCTGFFDDETETPEDYRDMLVSFKERGAPLICANPDLVVTRGNRLIPCAGALAALYDELGGETRIAGKPHTPIYEAAFEKARSLAGEVDKSRILAIGDGMPTDVKGALDYGLDLLFIAEGIHAADYTVDGKVDEALLDRFLTEKNAKPKYWMPDLA